MFAKFLTAALMALPLAQTVLAGDCTRSYTVKDGDICDSISAANNVSTYQLAAVNSGTIDSTCSNLVPGSTLCLGYTGEDCTTTYIVVKDDTCEQIASNFQTNTTILYQNNPQINQDCSNIYIGEVLCTSNQVQVPPAPAGSPPATAIPSTALPAIPSTTPAAIPSTTPAANPSPTPAPADTSDDDLPYCDEL